MAYASGRYSVAICDRCGFRYKSTKLRKEWTAFRGCSECYEPKHPQLDPPRHLVDPQALKNPSPSVPASRVAGAGVVRTIDPNRMITVTGDSIGSAFDGIKDTISVGTVTVTV